MGKKLFIIEAGGKVKKLEKILGKDYIVQASGGHIWSLKDIDKENKFKPEYVVTKEKSGTVAKLKKLSKQCDEVILAADKDREGEFIAWSIAQELKLKNPKRVTYTSVTKKEVDNALKNYGEINQELVDARIARAVLDQLVGFDLTPLLTKNYGQRMSAGRVMSVVIKLIVDKEKEIEEFFKNGSALYYKFNGKFKFDENELDCVLYTKGEEENDELNDTNKKKKKNDEDIGENVEHDDINDTADMYKGSPTKIGIKEINPPKKVLKLLDNLKESRYSVHGVYSKKQLQYPAAPFMTSSLQQEASRKIGFNPKKTMSVAQKLYEGGYITYMRTDGVEIAEEGMTEIKKLIKEKYGKEYYKHKQYKTRVANAQEAHEAIRPTDVTVKKTELGDDYDKLYKLIWKRTVASQMVPAEFKVSTLQLDIDNIDNKYFSTNKKKLIFDGFLKVYDYTNNDTEDEEKEITGKFPKKNDEIEMINIVANQESNKPPVRYNEASLVDKMKKTGIGRPSTYASVVDKIQGSSKNGKTFMEYVKISNVEGKKIDGYTLTITKDSDEIKKKKKKITIGNEKRKLIPTEIGIKSTEYLDSKFDDVMNYKFTSNMEQKLDDISNGKEKWNKIIKEFYSEFEPKVKEERENIKDKAPDNVRELGEDDDGNKVIAKMGIHGAYVMICENKNIKKCRKSAIKEPYTFETIKLKHALKLLQFPKNLGKHKNEDVMLCEGKHGMYIKYKDANYGLSRFSKDENGEEIDLKNLELEKAIEIINSSKEEKKKSDLFTLSGKDYKFVVKEGQYGRYVQVTSKKKKKISKPINMSMPKSIDIKDLNEEKLEEMLANYYAYKSKQTPNKKFKKGSKK